MRFNIVLQMETYFKMLNYMKINKKREQKGAFLFS
jgi:hypothetical protein